MEKVKTLLKYTIIFCLTGYLLYVSYTSIDPENLAPGQTRGEFILAIWKESNVFFLILSGICAVLSHVVRAERWRILLEPLGYKISLLNGFHAVMNGYFVNLFLPRGGEISRPYTLKTLENVPAETGIGTVLMERIIDLILLVTCIGTVVIFQLSKFSNFMEQIFSSPEAAIEKEPFFTLTKMSFIGAIFVCLIFVSYYLLKTKKYLFLKILVRIKNLLIGLKQGLLSIFKLKKRAQFLIYSFLIWVLYYLMLYTVLLAFKETSSMSFMDGLTIFTVSGIAMAMPMPGGTGTYHYLVPKALVLLCGMAELNRAIAFATIFHAYQTLLIIVLGFIGLIVINNSKKSKKHGY